MSEAWHGQAGYPGIIHAGTDAESMVHAICVIPKWSDRLPDIFNFALKTAEKNAAVTCCDGSMPRAVADWPYLIEMGYPS